MSRNTAHPAAAIKNPQNELIDRNKRKRGQRAWNDAQRAQAAARARVLKPWKHSTGPKTAAGKLRSSMNAYKHGHNTRAYRELKWVLREQARYLRELNAWRIRCKCLESVSLPAPEFAFAFVPFECYQGRLFSLNKTKTRSEKCPRY